MSGNPHIEQHQSCFTKANQLTKDRIPLDLWLTRILAELPILAVLSLSQI